MASLSVHESGLVLAEEAMGQSALRHALKQIDSRLRLLPPTAEFPGTARGYWRVVRQWSDDHPASPVLTWMDANSNPLELTARLIDEVQRHHLGLRGYGKTADERNAELEAAVKKERADSVAALHDEYAAYLERGRVGVSVGAHNKIPYWQRRNRGGYEDGA